ncbi:beta-lactamase family protein [Phototrophicus methaneseepsis]|uniref:Beta-lactamase family protein n=1 Tax=Phototrophicus methaneseepsis TaxID=2710758 RepID=A0A7S8E925_9CHLR|nr:serine hydrolase domain-containing protein [Phototrophicus methaneseepsis]QPC82631.1 beta-lactamase family protein [Phototrophicus methaneseepsis]
MKTWVMRILAMTMAMMLLVPVAAQEDITLVPFTDETFGITGVRPEDWTELAPGSLSPDGGMTILVQQAAPGATADQILQSLLPNLLLSTAPESVETYESDALTWDVYFVEVDAGSVTILVDLALSEQDGTAYVVLFQTTPDQYEGMHPAVFEAALEAYAPLASNPEAEGDMTGEEGDAEGGEDVPGETLYADPDGLFMVPVPTNWTVTEGEGYMTLAAPADFSYTIVTLETDDLIASLDEAWEIAGAPEGVELDYDEDDVQNIDDPAILTQLGGIDAALQVIYEDGTGDDERIVLVFAQRYDGVGYYWLVDGTITAIQQRQAQANIIESGFQIMALEEDDLTDAEAGELTPELIAELEAFIGQAMEEWQTPGLSVAIVDGDEILYSNGFGVLELGQDTPVDADTMMMIGSITKPMTTTVMGMLVDDGLLDWDAPVRDVLPEFSVQSEELSETITIANLACACTGVPRRDLELIFNANDLTAEDIIDSLATFQFFTEFGEAFQYSNQLVATAGYVAAAANGGEYGQIFDAYQTLMHTRLIDPLEMSRTVISLDSIADYDNVATSHGMDIYDDPIVNPLSVEVFADPIAPAGAIWSTATDMSQYLMLMLNQGETSDGDRLVSTESLQRTWQPGVSVSADIRYGLGWLIENWKGIQVINHGGNTLGFSAELAFVPDADLGIIVLANQQYSSTPLAVRTRFLELVYGQEETEVLFPSDIDRTEIEEDEQEFYDSLVMEASDEAVEQFTGTYTSDVLGELVISVDDNGELVADTGEFQSPLWLTTNEDADPNTYIMSQPPFAGQSFVFEVADDGTVTATIGAGVVEYTFTKE